MKNNKMKGLLTICFLILAQNVLSQSKPFTIEPFGGDGFYLCDMDSKEILKDGKTAVRLSIGGAKDRFSYTTINIDSYREDIVALYNKTTVQSNGPKYKQYHTQILLENGEVLSTNESMLIDRRTKEYQGSGIGIGELAIYHDGLKSNKNSMNNFSDLQKEQYVCQQLRKYSIVKVIINHNVTIDFGTFKTKDTFNAMFNTLGAKIGAPERFRR